MTLSAGKFAAGVTPDDAAVKVYYDAHKAEYMTPETVNLRYVELSLSQLESKVSVDDAQLKAFYEEQKTKTPERFLQAEQRRVRHILLSVNDPKEDAAVKTKAEGILKRAKGGEDFSKLAKEFSQDALHPAFAALKRLGRAGTTAALKGLKKLDLAGDGEGIDAPVYKARLLGMVVRGIEGDEYADYLFKREAEKETDPKRKSVFEYVLSNKP